MSLSPGNIIKMILRRLQSVHWKTALQPQNLFAWEHASSRRSSETAWLDGLRGVAALQVLLFHFFVRYRHWALTFGDTTDFFHQWPMIRSIWCGGNGAVALFFVISGYALTLKSFMLIRQRKYDDLFKQLGSSVIRRGFRLYLPVLAISLPSILLIQYFDLSMEGYLAGPQPKANLIEQILSWFKSTDHLLNPYLYPDHDPHFDGYPYVPAAWTIPLEYRGSIICYILVLSVSRVKIYRIRAWICFGMTAYALHRGSWWNSNFFMGLSLADRALEQKSTQSNLATRRRPLRDTGYLIMFLLGLWWSGMPPKNLPGEEPRKPRPGFEILYNFYPPVSIIQLLEETRWYWYWSGNFIFIAVSQLAPLRRIFETGVCQWLGKLSFAVYLVHSIVYAVFTDYVRGIITPITNSSFVVGLVEFGTMVPLSFILGGLIEKYIDQASVDFARRFEKHITREPPSSSSSSVVNDPALGLDKEDLPTTASAAPSYNV